MYFISERLSDCHDLSVFDCGKPPLNDWLRKTAWRANTADTARVYVWTLDGETKAMAYFAISPTLLLRDEEGIPSNAAGGTSQIPGYLIGRLGIDVSLQGSGYGKELLYDAITKTVAAAEIGAGRLIVVDALDEDAESFYRKYNFKPVQNRERRLFMKMAARQALGIRY